MWVLALSEHTIVVSEGGSNKNGAIRDPCRKKTNILAFFWYEEDDESTQNIEGWFRVHIDTK